MNSPAQRVIDRISQTCPQCQGEGRLHECDHGCGFKGCAACCIEHEAEPHGDDVASRELIAGVERGCK